MWLSLVIHKGEMSVFKVLKPVVKPMYEYDTFKKKKQQNRLQQQISVRIIALYR